jgi:hypothetical protein
MEYIRGDDFITYTNSASKEEFEKTVSILIDFISSEFENSKLENFPYDVWESKVKSVINVCKDQNHFSSSMLEELDAFLLEQLPEKIHIGNCHGDLTFSNVIVERFDRVCVFDFLDPPFETPYEDVAKFLQDANFFWSINKHLGSFDKTRVKIYWSHASEMLLEKIGAMCDLKTLRKFQVLGLLRILPYTTDLTLIQFLKESLNKEVKNDSFTSVWRRVK